ncbi:lysine methyltransferase [Planktothricoides sp. SR001]|nr:lysine methyltransferase [Planktothricoides sp. SR001]
MIHPDTQMTKINDVIGYGVIATKLIPKGTIVWILDDLTQRLDESFVHNLDEVRKKELLKYCYRYRSGEFAFVWDLGRFLNHNSNPNCITTAYDFEIAVRDIYPGEEITIDYGTLNLDEPFECLRNDEEAGVRHTILPDDPLNLYSEWDKKAAEAMSYFNQVEQPLKHLINDKYKDKVIAVAAGIETIDSSINIYYKKGSVNSDNT